MGEHEGTPTDHGDEEMLKFNATSRTGRRNALPSLDVEGVDTATPKLVDKMADVTTEDVDDGKLDAAESETAQNKGQYVVITSNNLKQTS
ncbi:unnamed protein product [Enterobius vermicularis]|uniref:CHZ domain-containing protein n=1 Tax=Enterobius vermicularis TaxID=51028 RepID=A0A0N4VLZ0_ENTVE|nr:unnamed protein product [Enterobius vermicularis]